MPFELHVQGHCCCVCGAEAQTLPMLLPIEASNCAVGPQNDESDVQAGRFIEFDNIVDCSRKEARRVEMISLNLNTSNRIDKYTGINLTWKQT